MPTATPQESRIVKNFRSGLIEIMAGAERYVVKAEQGNFTLNIPGRTVAAYLSRGKFVDEEDPEDFPQVAYDQDQPMTGSWTAYLRDFGGSDQYLSLMDFITQTGLFISKWGNELPEHGPDSPKLVTLQWWMRGSRVGDPANKGLRVPFAYLTGNPAEGSPNLITCNFTAYAVYPQPARWER